MIRRWFIAVAALIVSLPLSQRAVGSQLPSRVVEVPGTYLKWIRVAEAQLDSQALKVENYMLSISDEGDVLSVSFVSSDCPSPPSPIAIPKSGETYVQLSTKGSCGTYPAYAVHVRKKDSKVVRSYYQR